MDTYDAISTKLDVKNFASKPVPGDVKRKILEGARLTGSSMNSQHWRFILVQERPNLQKLAADSTSGLWIDKADFAVVILINPKIPGSVIDAGRVLQDMQLTAWNFGVVSRPYTGIKADDLRRDFGIPIEFQPAAVLGFGYPAVKILGRKDRKSIEELVFAEKYGHPIDLKRL